MRGRTCTSRTTARRCAWPAQPGVSTPRLRGSARRTAPPGTRRSGRGPAHSCRPPRLGLGRPAEHRVHSAGELTPFGLLGGQCGRPLVGQPVDAAPAALRLVPGADQQAGILQPVQSRVDGPLGQVERASADESTDSSSRSRFPLSRSRSIPRNTMPRYTRCQRRRRARRRSAWAFEQLALWAPVKVRSGKSNFFRTNRGGLPGQQPLLPPARAVGSAPRRRTGWPPVEGGQADTILSDRNSRGDMP